MRTPDAGRFWGGPWDGHKLTESSPAAYRRKPSAVFLPCRPLYDDSGALIVRPLGSAERYERDASGLWRWRGTFVPADGQAA